MIKASFWQRCPSTRHVHELLVLLLALLGRRLFHIRAAGDEVVVPIGGALPGLPSLSINWGSEYSEIVAPCRP